MLKQAVNPSEEISAEKFLESIGAKPMTAQELAESALIKKQIPFTEKYRKGLKTITRMNMRELSKAHPEWGLPETLAALVKGYNPELPPPVLLEMVQHIIAQWEDAHIKKRTKLEPALV